MRCLVHCWRTGGAGRGGCGCRAVGSPRPKREACFQDRLARMATVTGQGFNTNNKLINPLVCYMSRSVSKNSHRSHKWSIKSAMYGKSILFTCITAHVAILESPSGMKVIPTGLGSAGRQNYWSVKTGRHRRAERGAGSLSRFEFVRPPFRGAASDDGTAGGLEYDSAADFYRVVGEPFVVPAQ
jgi:hypothetical protein